MDKFLIKLIQNSLTPDLLDSKFWRERQKKRPMAGFCYVASECYHYLRGKYEGYKPHHIKVRDGSADYGHWFLKSQNGEILDITASQFKRTPDYSKAKCRGWLTKNPSKRAKIIINRVREKCKHEWTREPECSINFCHHCCQAETEILKNEIARLKSELERVQHRGDNAKRQSIPRNGIERKSKR